VPSKAGTAPQATLPSEVDRLQSRPERWRKVKKSNSPSRARERLYWLIIAYNCSFMRTWRLWTIGFRTACRAVAQRRRACRAGASTVLSAIAPSEGGSLGVGGQAHLSLIKPNKAISSEKQKNIPCPAPVHKRGGDGSRSAVARARRVVPASWQPVGRGGGDEAVPAPCLGTLGDELADGAPAVDGAGFQPWQSSRAPAPGRCRKARAISPANPGFQWRVAPASGVR